MIFKSFSVGLIARAILIFGAMALLAWCLLTAQWACFFLLILLLTYQFFELIRFIGQVHTELAEFTEAVRYQDFSRRFNEKKGTPAMQQLYRSFNQINSVFRQLSREKEAQFLYLQKILELVDTGILSYDEDGNVLWLNEAFKKILRAPYLKRIEALAHRDMELYEAIRFLKPGERRIAKARIGKMTVKILMTASQFVQDGRQVRLIAIQNVNEALDETETEAWQKLLRVLTHEIMNSVAPIASLTDTLKTRLNLMRLQQAFDPESLNDMELGVDTIGKRSEGLLRFAETYRNLNKIAVPTLSKVYIRDLFEQMYTLMHPSLDQKGIVLEIILKDPGLTVEADRGLIEQVLINLILNAMDALRDQVTPRILLSADLSDKNRIIVEVVDNGTGMSPEMLEKIFVPFFSTRKNGSGIGLSLSKQIMLLHKGNIQVRSTEGMGTRMMLVF